LHARLAALPWADRSLLEGAQCGAHLPALRYRPPDIL